MFRVIFDPDRQRVPIRVWARKINEETERQLQRLASQPYVVDHVCAMADAHVSSGIAVGSVFATERTVVPRALGGDLGCGMSAVSFSTTSEIDRDAEGDLWLLVHSGSRGLTGLDTSTEEGAAYLDDVTWALAFARANRQALCKRAIEVLGALVSDLSVSSDGIDIHHNFVARETWNDRELLVHRKGAIAVPAGAAALIPGSMGTASYIVEGLGSASSFGSCSHGAGRVMSRKEARAAIRLPAFEQSMRRVVYPEHIARQLVEEAPAAYRDITAVLDDQKDLVKKRVRLEPMAVLKG